MTIRRRFAPSLIALMLGCTALAAPAHAGWLFGGDDEDAKKPAPAAQEAAAKPVPAADIEGNVRQARMLRLAGNYEEAIHHLSQLMLVASDDPRVVGEYGKTLAQMGRAQDAVQFLTRAQQLNAADWSIYSALGVAYDQLGDQAQAQTAYQHALALKPNEPSVLNNYALSRMLAKDPDGARALAAQVRAAGGESDPMIRRNLAMIAEMAPAPAGEKAEPAKTAAAPVAAPAPKVASAALPAPETPAKETPVKDIPAKPAPQHPAAATNSTAFTVAGNARPFVTLPATPAAASVAQPRPATSPRGGTIEVSAAPKPMQPTGVVMQQVPVDPLAGPVARKATHEPRALAAHEPAPKAVASNETPAKDKPAAQPVAKAEAAKPEPAKAPPQLAKAEPKKPDAKAEAKSEAKPVKAAAKDSAKDTVPALRLSANAY